MQKYKVLIADDHAMIRDGVKNLIKQNKALVVVGEAVNGTETLRLFQETTPDLIILDISMPDMNGMDVAKQILSVKSDSKIIILSMYDDEDYISRCLESGVMGYVVKSESGVELDYAINAVLEGKNYFSKQAQDIIFRNYAKKVNQKKQRDQLINLTNRETEIIGLIAEGLTSQQMADKLFISPRTVETHRANVMKKVGVKNAVELVKKAQQYGLI